MKTEVWWLESRWGTSPSGGYGDACLCWALDGLGSEISGTLEGPAGEGLDNLVLQEQKPFDEHLVNILQGYLERLPRPICIVAHNGNKFDFPILQSELQFVKKGIPDDVLCIDSLVAFKELLCAKKSGGKKENPTPDLGITQLNGNHTVPPEPLVNFQDEFDDDLCKVLDIIEEIPQIKFKSGNDSEESKEDPFACLLLLDEQLTDSCCTTPKRNSVISYVPSPTLQECIQAKNETTPKHEDNIIKISKPPVMKTKVNAEPTDTSKRNRKDDGVAARKRLNFSPPEFGDVTKTPKSFKLIDIYQFLLSKKSVNDHMAESDCLNLLECIVTMGPTFVEWVDKNAKLFSLIKKRW
ncbi:unnamed protein product [Timema podura]|uniref:Three prime repair exonuclease 1 n=1 Tax=Timema podura TaxID=61482 RepID=A0ABN7NC04_TIMPD|nr:unnamed protein product [Timema podura]